MRRRVTVESRSPSTADLAPSDFERDKLLRRIPSLEDEAFCVVNTETGEARLSSACFKLRSDETGLSIYSQTIVTRRSLTYEDVCRKPHNAVASISGTEPLCHGLQTIADPWPPDAPEPDHPRNAAHAIINGIRQLAPSKQRKLARDLAKIAVIVHPVG